MFDLPSVTPAERKEYNRFRKNLLKEGFIMMQESVYSKLAQNQLAANALIDHVKRYRPSDGLIQILTVTEKQYNNIVMVIGQKNTDVDDSSERMIVI